ncbi:hypothetical protein GQR58_023749 [Nymphon striatum]|nr:hypothetical protein GQR58_023749 [Nymphon striatum]
MLSIIGKLFRDAGLRDLAVESGVIAEGSIDKVLDGKQYNRGVRLHKLTYEALMRLVWKGFLEWLENNHSTDLPHLDETFRVVMAIHGDTCATTLESSRNEESCQRILHLLCCYLNVLKNDSGHLVAFWMIYLEMVEILLGLIRADREGAWYLHLASILTNSFSDHQSCFLTVKLRKDNIKCPTHVMIRRTDGAYYNNFLRAISDPATFSCIHDNPDADPNVLYSNFIEILSKLHEEHMPLKKVKFDRYKHKLSPWMTQGLLKSIERRDKLFRKLRRLPLNTDRYHILKFQLDNLNTILRSLIDSAKDTHLKDRFSRVQGNIKRTWSVLNSALNRNKTSSLPTSFNINGNLISDPVVIARELNNYFATIGPDLADKISNSSNNFKDFLTNPVIPSFNFSSVSENDVLKIINDLPNKTSFGIDNISSKTIKSVKGILVKPLTLLVVSFTWEITFMTW